MPLGEVHELGRVVSDCGIELGDTPADDVCEKSAGTAGTSRVRFGMPTDGCATAVSEAVSLT